MFRGFRDQSKTSAVKLIVYGIRKPKTPTKFVISNLMKLVYGIGINSKRQHKINFSEVGS